MTIKNISGLELTIGSKILLVDETIDLSEFGTKDDIRFQSDYILEAFLLGSIECYYNDGVKIEDSTIISNQLNDVTSSEINISNVSEIANEIAEQTIIKSYNNYYFLKDEIEIKKNQVVEKVFRGRVKSLYLIPKDSNISVEIITGDGVKLPADNLSKRQTLEFNFDGDLKDCIVKIKSKGSGKIEMFMEGWNNEFTPQELQDFVNCWYNNSTNWLTSSPVIVSYYNNTNKENPRVESSVDGLHILYIDDNKEINSYKGYKFYYIDNKEYFVEYIESNRWSTWNPNRYAVRAKNITYIQFNDELVDLRTEDLYDYYLNHDDEEN